MVIHRATYKGRFYDFFACRLKSAAVVPCSILFVLRDEYSAWLHYYYCYCYCYFILYRQLITFFCFIRARKSSVLAALHTMPLNRNRKCTAFGSHFCRPHNVWTWKFSIVQTHITARTRPRLLLLFIKYASEWRVWNWRDCMGKWRINGVCRRGGARIVCLLFRHDRF